MNGELKKLVDCAIDDLFEGGLTLNSNHIQIINELAELAALRGVVDYQNSQIGAFKK